MKHSREEVTQQYLILRCLRVVPKALSLLSGEESYEALPWELPVEGPMPPLSEHEAVLLRCEQLRRRQSVGTVAICACASTS